MKELGQGVIAALIVVALIWYLSATVHYFATKSMIEDCESNLPRDVHCVLKAVPEEGE